MSDWQAEYDAAVRAPLEVTITALRAEVERLREAVFDARMMMREGQAFGLVDDDMAKLEARMAQALAPKPEGEG